MQDLLRVFGVGEDGDSVKSHRITAWSVLQIAPYAFDARGVIATCGSEVPVDDATDVSLARDCATIHEESPRAESLNRLHIMTDK